MYEQYERRYFEGRIPPKVSSFDIGLTFLIPILIFGVPLVVVSIRYISDNLVAWLRHPWSQWVCTIILIVGSLTLFAIRQYFRVVYGVMEISLGCGVAWVSTDQIADQPRYGLPGIISAAYFLVRGFDNFREGLKKRREKQQKEKSIGTVGHP